MTDLPSPPPAPESVGQGGPGGSASSIHHHRRHKQHPSSGIDKTPITTIGLTKPASTSTINTARATAAAAASATIAAARAAKPPPAPLKAAEPVLSRNFDPWNSSSSGHQRAENRLGSSTGWRESRNSKLMAQYGSRGTGGQRISDSVGAGSQDYDGDLQQLVRPEARFRARNSVLTMLAKPGLMRAAELEFAASAARVAMLPVAGTARVASMSSLSSSSSYASAPSLQSALKPMDPSGLQSQDSFDVLTAQNRNVVAREAEDGETASHRTDSGDRPGLLAGVVVYVNGSTHPHVSDHKLKQLLAEHGGRMSTHLGRRKVTHVILGRPSSSRSSGAGGGLAGGKLHREIQKVGGYAVKYVGVEWVLESIKAGKRLPEARFANLKIAAKTQGSVYGLCTKSSLSLVDKTHVTTMATQRALEMGSHAIIVGHMSPAPPKDALLPTLEGSIRAKSSRLVLLPAFTADFEPPPSAQRPT